MYANFIRAANAFDQASCSSDRVSRDKRALVGQCVGDALFLLMSSIVRLGGRHSSVRLGTAAQGKFKPLVVSSNKIPGDVQVLWVSSKEFPSAVGTVGKDCCKYFFFNGTHST